MIDRLNYAMKDDWMLGLVHDGSAHVASDVVPPKHIHVQTSRSKSKRIDSSVTVHGTVSPPLSSSSRRTSHAHSEAQ
jgi:hypothetical protein